MLSDFLKGRHLVAFWRDPAQALGLILDQGRFTTAFAWFALTCLVFQWGVNQHLRDHYERIPNPQYESWWIQHGQQFEMDPESFDAVDLPVPFNRAPLPLIGEIGWLWFSFTWSHLFTHALGLLLFAIPVMIGLLRWAKGMGYYSQSQGVYAPLVMTVSQAWCAAHLPLGLLGFLVVMVGGPDIFLVIILLAAKASFLWFTANAMHRVCRTSIGLSLAVVTGLVPLSVPFQWISGLLLVLLSPFFLIFFGFTIWQRGKEATRGFTRSQNMKRHLEALTINPNDADAHLQIAEIYHQRGQWDQSLDHLQKALAIDDRDPDTHYWTAKTLIEKGELQRATVHLEQAIAINPRHAHWEVQRELGRVFFLQQRYQEAIEVLDSYCNQRSFDPQGLYLLGSAYLAQDDRDLAKEFFERALDAAKTAPDYRQAEVALWGRKAKKSLNSL